MLSHGVVSCGLFYCVGILYERYKTRNILYFGGLAQLMPLFSTFIMIFILSNLSFPGTSSFVGEILVLFGFFSVNMLGCLLLSTTMVLSCVYSLWLLNRLIFGNLKNYYINYADLSFREFTILLFLVLIVAYLGLFSYNLSDYLYCNTMLYSYIVN